MRERIEALRSERASIPVEFERLKVFYQTELEQHRQRLQARIDELTGRITALEEIVGESA